MGKKAKTFAEVACIKHGVSRGTDSHRSVKVGQSGLHKKAKWGCPDCNKETKIDLNQ